MVRPGIIRHGLQEAVVRPMEKEGYMDTNLWGVVTGAEPEVCGRG